ncbi:hypothetical protein [Prosthecobacter fluviatilis]|uniref:Uncharacterized protein n=1 Tax=Prosthecobacter fluviatilis TaxID=445931 RepID=A0ABW0KSK7_9BACT
MRFVVTALLVILLGSAVLRAETLIIPVVGEGWQIKFKGPVLAVESQQYNADGQVFQGNAGRFNVSAFVGKPAGSGGDSKACRDHFWKLAGEGGMIQKDSVKQWSTPYCECVAYVTKDESQGEASTRANISCCFEILGKWAHLHASVISATDEETQMLKELAESLMYCTFARYKGGSQEFLLGGMGRLRMNVPVSWRAGNHCVNMGIGTAEQHELSFFSTTDPGKTWKMTFFNCAMRYKTQADIELTARTAPRPAKGEPVEQAVALQEIKLKQGVGCLTVYTHAEQGDKPVATGAARVSASGFVAPVPDVLGTITLSADDAKDADFMAAIQALGTIEWEPVEAR